MKHIRKLKTYIRVNGLFSVLIPLLLVSLMLVPAIFWYAQQDISSQNEIITESISKDLSDFIQEAYIPLYQLNDLMEKNVLTNEEQIKVYLKTVIDHISYIDGFEIINASGVVDQVVPENNNILGVNRSNQNFFKTTITTQQPFVSDVFISQQSRTPAVTIAIPYQNGVLAAYLNLEEISLISSRLSETFGPGIIVSITDKNGLYLSDQDINKVYQREIYPQFNIVEVEKSVDTIKSEADGKTLLTNYKHIEHSDWYIFVSQTYDGVYDILKWIFMIIFISGLIFLTVSYLMTHYGFENIRRSFEDLNTQTYEVAAGDYHPISISNRYKEFETLILNFNQMVKSLRERDETLNHLAYYDVLTQLPNLAYLTKEINQMIENECSKLAILCFDIDDFDKINDSYGPDFGNQILSLIGKRLAEIKLDNGFISRFSDSKFIQVISGFENVNEIVGEFNRITELFKEPIILNNRHIYIRFHMGSALYPEHSRSVDELLHYAHAAADIAKTNDAQRHVFFEDQMNKVLLRNMELETALRSALDKDEFYLQYQPQVDMKSGSIRGFEALIRWQHPQLGRISPFEFIQLAESNRLIIPIGAWVLETACRKMVELNEKTGTNLMISVNVSAVQLNHESFIPTVEAVVSKTGIDPKLLELEITESLFIHSYEDVFRIFEHLQRIGIKLSLDDFGTGYSSLSYLKNLPIDTLKVDQTFTRDLLKEKSHERLMESIISMAHKLEMEVIVEGVEEKDQLDRLEIFSSDYVQGYYYSKPVSFQEIEEMIKKGFIK